MPELVDAGGVDVEEVEAVFVHVRDDRVVAPRLDGRAELERLLGPDDGPPDDGAPRPRLRGLPSAR